MLNETIACAIASSVDAYWRCHKDVNTPGRVDPSFLPLREEWLKKWPDRIEWLAKNHLPSGSGFDCGTVLDLEKSRAERLVFVMEYHRMTEHGYYDGWVTFTAVARPSFIHGITVDVTGGKVYDDSDLRDHAAELLRQALRAQHPRETLYPKWWSEKAVAS